MYEWKELIELWAHERLTQEQVIGQLLKYGEQVHSNEAELRRRVENLESTVATFLAREQAGQTTPAKQIVRVAKTKKPK